MQQFPLLDNNPLPSPSFRPRPGWGGRLRAWSHEHLYLVVFRTLVVAAIVLIGASLIRSWRAVHIAQSPSPSPSASVLTALYELVADHGVGMTHLAAKALDAYLATQNDRLDAPRHLYAVDTLAREAGWRRLKAGETVIFNTETLSRIIASAKTLAVWQIAAWARFLQ